MRSTEPSAQIHGAGGRGGVGEGLHRALEHSEKIGLSFDQGVAYWRQYYASHPSGAEPVGAERLRVFGEALAAVRANGLWLDAGCGIGMMARHFREVGLRLCGIDMSAALLEEAHRVTGLRLSPAGDPPTDGEHLSRASVERIPYRDEHFDGAYSCSVLEYVADLGLALSELRRVVRRDGHLIFNLPNAFSISRISNALRRRHDEYFRLVPRWAYWRWEIVRTLKRSGWDPLQLSYYGAERYAPGLPLFVPQRLRHRLAVQPWAASFLLVIAKRR